MTETLSILEATIFGFIQGLTEWFPISSSGHLAVAQELIGKQPPVIFHVLLHVGTLVVVLFFFRKDISMIVAALLRRNFESMEGKLGIYVILGSIPTAIIGYLFHEAFESFFSNLLVVGIGFVTTGFLLSVSEIKNGNKSLDILDSLLLGITQGISIIPGISRSGSTISIALLRSVKKELAFKFSFLLSIPAVVGATLSEWTGLEVMISGGAAIAIIVGVSLSMIVGYLSLRVLQTLIMKQKFRWFAFYCWTAGVIVLAFRIL